MKLSLKYNNLLFPAGTLGPFSDTSIVLSVKLERELKRLKRNEGLGEKSTRGRKHKAKLHLASVNE